MEYGVSQAEMGNLQGSSAIMANSVSLSPKLDFVGSTASLPGSTPNGRQAETS